MFLAALFNSKKLERTQMSLKRGMDTENVVLPGSGGACLSSQHLGGRGRWISEFKVSLVYKVSSRTARAIQRTPSRKTKKKKKKKKNKQKKTPKKKKKTTKTPKENVVHLHNVVLLSY
jgi:hypothetical protein